MPAGGSGTADSAGVPWAGRTLAPQAFAGDTGEADPALEVVLRALPGAGAAGTVDEARVVAALAGTRLLVPVVAVLGGEDGEPASVRATSGDKSADMALVTLTLPGERQALPAFTSRAALAAWDPAARPVPVEAERAAQAAVAQGCTLMLLDPPSAGPGPGTGTGGAPRAVVRRPALWALGQGRTWVPSPADPDVAAAVARACTGVPGLVAARTEPGQRAELRVVLGVAPGLGRRELDDLLAEVGARLAGDDLLTERVESLELRVLPA